MEVATDKFVVNTAFIPAHSKIDGKEWSVSGRRQAPPVLLYGEDSYKFAEFPEKPAIEVALKAEKEALSIIRGANALSSKKGGIGTPNITAAQLGVANLTIEAVQSAIEERQKAEVVIANIRRDGVKPTETARLSAQRERKRIAEKSIEEKVENLRIELAANKKIARAKRYRNNLQSHVLARSEEICTVHKGQIIARAAVVNFSGNLAAAVLSGTSTALGGALAKSALSAASAVATTGTALYNEEFYQNLLAAAVVKNIESRRSEFWEKTIIAGQEKMVDEYSVRQAIRDAEKYHNMCSFMSGIQALAEKDKRTTLTTEEARAEIKALEKDNLRLSNILTDKSVTGAVRAAASRSHTLNSTRIFELRALIGTGATRGVVRPRAAGEAG